MENRYLHQQYDEQMRQLWQTEQTYRQLNPAFKTYTIDTPPPTVSGSLHIGHIFSYTQTDIIARYKRMTGHNVFYPFGFDCNGLATERFVEKKHNTNVSKIGRENFINLCLSTTEEMKVKFVELWRTMGLSAELENTYSTIAPDVQKISQESFIDLVRKDFAYIKNEPALYCTLCRTTVAQAELDDMEQTTNFNDVTFATTDGQTFTIATTRPELLPSCVGIIFHPDDARYTKLMGKKAIVPLFGQEVPIFSDDKVQPDKGTGIVMTCTFGDKTDIEWYKKYNLPYKQSIGFDGKFAEFTGVLAGLNVADARKKVIELLKEQNLLVNQKQIQNTVNVHERCKHPIEYVILPQWFIKVVQHSDQFLQQANKINWYPAHMKARFDDWVKNLSWDWGISRQRVFGIPFPVWYCNDCSEILLADINQLPVDPQKTAYGKPCPKCSSTNIRPEKDVMDTWNTSSLTPYICKTLYNNKGLDNQWSPFSDTDFIPMSMRPQAHDIIRTWAFYTIVKSWMHQKEIPWHDIIISGYVLSENKEKISKSKDNAPTDPEKLLTMHAPDAVRFWTASGTLGHDIAFSPEQITIGQKLLTKLWNAFKFIHINNQTHAVPTTQPTELGLVNAWMLDRINICLKEYHQHFNNNEFSLALQAVEKIFWNDFCDNYLEIIKDQLFNPANYDPKDLQATMWTLNIAGLQILQLYAPYLPHITEYLFQQIFVSQNLTSLGNVASIHLTQLPIATQNNDDIAQQMNLMLSIIGQVRKLKTGAELSLRTPIQHLMVCGLTEAQITLLQQNEAIIKGVCKANTLELSEKHHETNLVTQNELWYAWIQVL